MWIEVGWSRRPQMTLSSILISPIRPVATKSIGTAVFLPTITCEWSAFLSPVSNIQMVLKPLLDIAEKSSDPIVDLAV